MKFSRVLVMSGLILSAALLVSGRFGELPDFLENDIPDSATARPEVTTIYVAPDGQDRVVPSASSGQKRIGPLKTLDFALKTARDLQNRPGYDRAVVVQLEAGIYRVVTAIHLDRGYSGTKNRPFVIRGDPGGGTVIRGSHVLGNRVSTMKLPHGLRNRLTTLQHKNLIAFRISAAYLNIPSVAVNRQHFRSSGPVPFSLHDQQGSLRPAQYPNLGKGWLETRKAGKKPGTFISGTSRLNRWSGEPDLWAGGYWKWDWSYETLPVGRVDLKKKMVTLKPPPHLGMGSSKRYFIFHALAELDEPGEWYLDRKRGYLLVWPRRLSGSGTGPGQGTENPVELSLSNSLFTVTGASHIRLEQLVLEYSRHDAVKVLDSDHIDIDRCIVRWVGGRAVVFRNSSASGIGNSTITDIASGGVVLDGGDRKTLVPAGLYVSNSRILRFSRLGRTYKPAVRLEGVGNTVFGNYIAESESVAIMFAGNDHVIERNEITKVARETSNVGAIYTGRDWSARGTRIINNYLHHISPGEKKFETKGIYLDDMASGIEVRGNVFFRVGQPIFMGGGRDNVVEQNMFIASKPGIYMDGRGLTWAKRAVINGNSELRKNLRKSPYRSPVWRRRYPHLANILEDDAAMPKYNILRHNLFVTGPRYVIESEVNRRMQSLGTDFGPDKVTVRSSHHIKDFVETAEKAEDFIPLAHKGFNRVLEKPLPLDSMDRWLFSGWQVDRAGAFR